MINKHQLTRELSTVPDMGFLDLIVFNWVFSIQAFQPDYSRPGGSQIGHSQPSSSRPEHSQPRHFFIPFTLHFLSLFQLI